MAPFAALRFFVGLTNSRLLVIMSIEMIFDIFGQIHYGCRIVRRTFLSIFVIIIGDKPIKPLRITRTVFQKCAFLLFCRNTPLLEFI